MRGFSDSEKLEQLYELCFLNLKIFFYLSQYYPHQLCPCFYTRPCYMWCNQQFFAVFYFSQRIRLTHRLLTKYVKSGCSYLVIFQCLIQILLDYDRTTSEIQENTVFFIFANAVLSIKPSVCSFNGA